MQEPMITHWSYSSMASLLSNPMAFKKKYVLGIYDGLTSPSRLVGTARHKAMESYYKGLPVDAAIQEGQAIIDNTSDVGIQFGKTGTRAGIVQAYSQAVNFAFRELPNFYELLGVEESITTDITSITGASMAPPAKAKIDIVCRNDYGDLEVTDWKFVTKYSDPNVDDFRKWLQGLFNYYVIAEKYGEPPVRMIYRECKISANKDGSPQMVPYIMQFTTADFATFERLYNDCTKVVSNPDTLFLPNPGDMFDGQATFELYRQGTMDVDAPVSIKRRTEQREYVEKQYVPSPVVTADNSQLTMEERIRVKLQEFGAPVDMRETFTGPSVTQYTMVPSRGVSMSKIAKAGRRPVTST